MYTEENSPKEYSDEYMQSLQGDVESAYDELDGFRQHRFERLGMFVGPNYSDGMAGIMDHNKIQYVNMFSMALRLYRSKLISGTPQAHVSSDKVDLRHAGVLLEKDLNILVQEMKLRHSLEDIVLDALISVGIAKIGLEETNQPLSYGNFRYDPGMPFVDAVSLDDFVYDTTADSFEKAMFLGNYYRVPLEPLLEDFPKLKKKITNIELLRHNKRKGELGASLSESSKRKQEPDSKWINKVDLLDLYLPLQNHIITVLANDFTIIVRNEEYDGPEGGPYRFLCFDRVPDNAMPVAPSAHWYDLNALINKLLRKIGRQAERHKFVGIVPQNSEAEAKILEMIPDGGIVGVPGAGNTKEFYQEMEVGGFSNQVLGLVQNLDMFLDKMMGNVSALAGLGPSSETASQDKLITQSASQSLKDMQDRTIEFIAQVLQDIAWYRYHDPISIREIQMQIPGTSIEFQEPYGPESRKEDDFRQYNLKIHPSSLQYKTPEEKLGQIIEIVQGQYMAMAQMFMEQGKMLDLDEYLNLIVRFTDTPELLDVIRTVAPPQLPPGPSAQSNQTPNKPLNTTRTYIRENVAQRTPKGNQQALQQALMGKDMQEDERRNLQSPAT